MWHKNLETSSSFVPEDLELFFKKVLILLAGNLLVSSWQRWDGPPATRKPNDTALLSTCSFGFQRLWIECLGQIIYP